ncbi:MAG: helix-turn-helix transcriptional regulator [Clostridia bacterium]
MKGLKMKRIEKGLSMRMLSEKFNVTIKTIYNYESGKTEPTFDMLQKLAKYFDCTIDALL